MKNQDLKINSYFDKANWLPNKNKYKSYLTQINNNHLRSKDITNCILLYPYYINSQRIESIIASLQLPIGVTKDILRSDVILALRSNVKQNTKLRQIAKSRHIIIYTVYNGTETYITRALKQILNVRQMLHVDSYQLSEDRESSQVEALAEVRIAIEKVVIGKKQSVELLSRLASVRKIQYQFIDSYNLRSRSFGKEPDRKLCIYPS